MKNSFSLLLLLKLGLAWATLIWYRQRAMKTQYVTGDLATSGTGLVFETFTIISAWQELREIVWKEHS